MANEGEVDQRLITETHRLIKNKEWSAINARLETDGGREDATAKDEHGRLFYHMAELYDDDVPISTLQAAYNANKLGFVTVSNFVPTPVWSPYCAHPMVIALRCRRPEVFEVLLKLHPDAAKEEMGENRYLLHYACIERRDTAVKLLLSYYPAAAAVSTGSLGDLYDYPLLQSGCFILNSHCTFETQCRLLSAHPNIAREKSPDTGDYLLHVMADNVHAKLFFHVWKLYPEATTKPNNEGKLPIHTVMTMSLYQVLPMEILDVLSEGHSNAFAQRDRIGKFPLHYFCANDGIYNVYYHEHDISRLKKLFREILRRFPDAAHKEDNDGFLPLHEILVGLEYDSDEATALWEGSELDAKVNSSLHAEMWCSLVEAAPRTLHRKHQDESPFLALSKRVQTPIRLWKNAAKYCPTALYSMAGRTERSPLAHALQRKQPKELLDSSSYSYSILKITFECMRNSKWYEEDSHLIVEETIPAIHMLAYCYHILDRKTIRHYVQDATENESLREAFYLGDSKKNTVLHILCHAPCPDEKVETKSIEEASNETSTPDEDANNEINETDVDPNETNTSDEASIVQGFLDFGITDQNARRMASTPNMFGDLPLHLLLRNRHPSLPQFNRMVDILMDWNPGASTMIDRKEGLYPFMVAAMNGAGRRENDACSATYTVLRQFISKNNFTDFLSKTMSVAAKDSRI